MLAGRYSTTRPWLPNVWTCFPDETKRDRDVYVPCVCIPLLSVTGRMGFSFGCGEKSTRSTRSDAEQTGWPAAMIFLLLPMKQRIRFIYGCCTYSMLLSPIIPKHFIHALRIFRNRRRPRRPAKYLRIRPIRRRASARQSDTRRR